MKTVSQKTWLTLLALSLISIAGHAESTQTLDPMVIAKGAKAWGDNCNRCHNMRGPKELRDDQWRAAVMHMRIRAGLTGEDTRAILEFLQQSN